MSETKVCSKCEKRKKLSEFAKQPTGRGGRRADCKVCQCSGQKERCDANRLRWAKEDPYEAHETGYKECPLCKENLHVSRYGTYYGAPDGLGAYCSPCATEKAKSYRVYSEPRTPVERFMEKVTIPEDRSECWTWTGSTSAQTGYGGFWGGNDLGKIYAHRFSAMMLRGEDIRGKVVRHTCDTGSCVNPSHLRVGTQQDNMDDRHNKGRYKTQEEVGFTKADIIEIRQSEATHHELAERYDVHSMTIWKIRNYTTHKQVS